MKNLKEDTEIFKTSFASAYGLQNSQKYVINYGLYDSDAFDDYANLARIMPDLEFYYFGKKFDSFLISKDMKILKEYLIFILKIFLRLNLSMQCFIRAHLFLCYNKS